MASVYVTIGTVGGLGAPAVFRGKAVSEVITSSGTSASGALTATRGQVAKVFCATPVYAAAVTGSTAVTAGTGIFIPGGVAEYIAMNGGEKIAVIDV